MKLDIKGFFMSIDRKLATDLVCRFVAERYAEYDVTTLLYLLRVSLMAAPENNCKRVGDVSQYLQYRKSITIL